MKKNKGVIGLEELRREKEILRRECAECEDVLAEQWSYVSENIGSLLFDSAIKASRRRMLSLLPIGNLGKSKDKNKEADDSLDGNLTQTLWGSLQIVAPFFWEIAQPLLLSFAAKKVKSIFSRKKK